MPHVIPDLICCSQIHQWIWASSAAYLVEKRENQKENKEKKSVRKGVSNETKEVSWYFWVWLHPQLTTAIYDPVQIILEECFIKKEKNPTPFVVN